MARHVGLVVIYADCAGEISNGTKNASIHADDNRLDPVGLCSAKIWSSDGQPLATVIHEQTDVTTNERSTHNAFSAGRTTNFIPLVRKNAWGQKSVIWVQIILTAAPLLLLIKKLPGSLILITPAVVTRSQATAYPIDSFASGIRRSLVTREAFSCTACGQIIVNLVDRRYNNFNS